MPEAVIVSTARTPIGRAFKGTLVDVDAFELAQHAVVAALQRSGVDPALVDDLVIAETLYGGGDIARYVASRRASSTCPAPQSTATARPA
jgi:acetyl-CoA C-acetyltransferase